MASKSKASGETKEKAQLYLAVTESREHGYFHLQGRFCTQKWESGEWVPYGVDDDYSDGLLWSGLRVSCQGDDRSQLRAGEGEQGAVYGFDCEYRDVYAVDLRKVRRMAKTLEKLQKGLGKITETRGYARSYGEYLGRVAEVFGCSGVVIERTQRTQRYGAQRWDWVSVGDGVNRVNHLIWQWVEEAKPKAQEAEALPAAGMREGQQLLGAGAGEEQGS
jgi:hypothetical protein